MADKKQTDKLTEKLQKTESAGEATQSDSGVFDIPILAKLPPTDSAYINDSEFHALLIHFQNAEWGKCLEKIGLLLEQYPQDAFFLAFKQEIEVRIKIHEARKQVSAHEIRQQQVTRMLNVLGFLLWAVMVGAGFLWAIQSYTSYQTNIRLEQEAVLLTEQLEAKYNNANIFLQAGRPEDALRLYDEIEEIYPGYRDVDERRQTANELIEIESLYQQGLRAFLAGNQEQSLQIFQTVEQLSPRYKDSQQRIQDIERLQRVDILVDEIKTAHEQENWQSVISLHDELKVLDPFLKTPELDEILFISYRNMVVQVAGKANASLEEIELAERYYRTALSLAPQSREFSTERTELQEIASSLLSSKYFLYGMDLLESSNYSLNGTREAIRLLNKAYNVGSGSPVVRAEIEKAQMFVDSYDSFLRQRWTIAIDGFEQLYRRDSNYANGLLRYLLFEAYLARGDTQLVFSDFDSALIDFQEAEKFAWGSKNNLVYLFKVETRIAYALRRLWRTDDAAEFYRFSFDHIDYQSLLIAPEQQNVLELLNQARSAYRAGNNWDAIRLYESALEDEAMLYQYITIKVSRGDSVAQIAFLYGTTIENLRTANRLGESMIIGSEQEILIPVFSLEQE